MMDSRGLYFKNELHEKYYKYRIGKINEGDKYICSAYYIISSMEMFYNTELLLNNNLNRDMILKRFEKASASEKTLIRIAMNLYRGCIDEDFTENKDEDFNMAKILNYILDEENIAIILDAYKQFSS